MKLFKLILIIMPCFLTACGPPSEKACKAEHWRIVEICRSWSGGPINARFYKCLDDQTYDNKKYDACLKEGHIVFGPVGPHPRRN